MILAPWRLLPPLLSWCWQEASMTACVRARTKSWQTGGISVQAHALFKQWLFHIDSWTKQNIHTSPELDVKMIFVCRSNSSSVIFIFFRMAPRRSTSTGCASSASADEAAESISKIHEDTVIVVPMSTEDDATSDKASGSPYPRTIDHSSCLGHYQECQVLRMEVLQVQQDPEVKGQSLTLRYHPFVFSKWSISWSQQQHAWSISCFPFIKTKPCGHWNAMPIIDATVILLLGSHDLAVIWNPSNYNQNLNLQWYHIDVPEKSIKWDIYAESAPYGYHCWAWSSIQVRAIST